MRGYYDCGYDKLMQGVDPDDYDHESEFWLTDDLRCFNCGHQFDIETIESYFVVEEHGVAPSTVDGYAVHWAYGHIDCPNCHVELPYETSS